MDVLVDFVSYDNKFLAFHTLLYVFSLCFGGLLIDKPKHYLRFLHLLVCSLNADILNDVVGIANSGCIDKAELYAIDDCGVFDEVACGAMYIANDGFLLM